MRRRDFISLLGGAAAAWPLAARAQQPGLPVIGLLSQTSAKFDAHRLEALRVGLRETGHVEGQNISLEYRAAAGEYNRLPTLASDLVRNHASVIVTLGGFPAARAAKAITTSIPIVFYVGGNPVDFGLVDSLSRPGGNLTGVSSLNAEFGPKRLELLHEVIPTAVRLAALMNPGNPIADPLEGELRAAARTLGLDLHALRAGTEQEIDAAFETLRGVEAQALVIGNDPFFNLQAEHIAALALRQRVPTIYQYHEFAAAGGLMSYGGSDVDAFRLVGIYTGRILKGERPNDLPVQQATKIELIINLKTAKALGLTVPITLLGRADEVIE